MKRTIATGFASTAKFAKTLATAIAALDAASPQGHYADLTFEHGGHTYKLVESPRQLARCRCRCRSIYEPWSSATGYLARIDSEC